MRVLLLGLLVLVGLEAGAQSIGYFRYDSTIIMKTGGTNELVIRNKTKDTMGFLFNTGNGVTAFRRVRQLNDTTFVMGADTVLIKSSASGGSGLNTLNGLNAGLQTLAIGTSGTAPNWVSATSTHTINIPSALTPAVTAGLVPYTRTQIWDAKIGPGDTAAMLANYLSGGDTISLSNRINAQTVAGIRGLIGDVYASAPSADGISYSSLFPTGVVPGTYTNATITVDEKGRLSFASSGAGGGGSGTDNVNGGSGYRWVIAGQVVRSFYAGTGLTLDSTSNASALTIKPDTAVLATKNYVNSVTGTGGITALTGDVTASGTGSVAATIANDAVTYAKFQNVTTSRLLGRYSALAGDMQEISLGAGLSLTGGVLDVVGGGGTTYSFTAPLSETGGVVSVANAVADGSTKGVASFETNHFNSSAGNISIDFTNGPAASAGVKGYLTPTDWSTFNNKISNITGLVTAGTNISLTGAGTSGSPYVINATPGGGGSGTVNSGLANTLAYYAANGTVVDDLAAITASRALVSNVNGLPVASSVTATELGYVSGVTSGIQTQLNGKQSAITTGSTAQYFRGDFSLATFPTNVSTFTNDASYLTNITGKVSAGTNVSVTGLGTTASPYVINSSAGTTYTGTTNRLTVTGSVLDIAATYVGQTSITTLGTIGVGTWQGTKVAMAYGGVPTGGTTGQMLVKINGTDNNVQWVDQPAGGGGVSSVSGTTNRITSTGGATPVIDISAAYIGQTSITTLGSIGTGTWQGSIVAGQYGGTGVANTGKSITLGGNLTTSGAFATTLTSTAATNVTLPTTGTLATLAGSEALTNKSVNGVTLVSGGSTTAFLNQSGTYTTPAGGGMTNPMTTIGDVIYGGASGTPTRLGIGTLNYVLTSNGAGVAPSWKVVPTTLYGTGYGITGDGENNFLLDTAVVSGSYIRRGNLVAGANVTITSVGNQYVIASSGGGSGITALTGDIAASGTGSVTGTIQANAVTTSKVLDANITYAKIQAVAADRILGRLSTSGTAQEIPLGTGMAFVSGALTSTVTGINSYYVDNSGLSTGSGSTEATAITFARLLTLSASFVGGERIYLKSGGTYYGRIPIKSGTVVTKYGSGFKPIIKGTIPSTSLTWTNAGSGIWTATSSARVGRLFRNSVPETNAQSSIYTSTARPASNQITASSATGLSNVTQMEMVAKEYDFRWKYHTITAYNSGTGNFTISPDDGMAVGFGFRLFNHESLITNTGDWAWRGSTVYYKSPGNVNPNTLDVELAVTEEGVYIEQGSTDIVIQDVDFFGQALDGVFGRDITNLTINGGHYQHQLMSGVALMGKSAGIVIKNIQVDSAMANGIVGVNQSNYEYSYNSFTGIGMNANWPYSRDQLVRYDWPVHINVGFAIQNYPIEGGANGYVHHNTAHNLVYNGIAVRTPLNTTVEANHIWDFCKKANDGAGIYTGSHEAAYYNPYKWVNLKGFKIINNLVHDGQGSFEGAINYGFVHAFGIYADNGEDGTQIIGNTSYNNNGAGFITNFYTKNTVFRGNTAYNNKTEQLRISNGTQEGQFTTEGIIVENNTFVSLGVDQRAVKIMNHDAGTFDPFVNGGSFKNNTIVSPYTNNVIQKATSVFTNVDYTLSGAKSFYSRDIGQQDAYTDSYSSDAAAQANVPLDVNTASGSSISITPSGFRAPLNRDFNSTLTPFGAAAYIEGSVSGGGGGGSNWTVTGSDIYRSSKVTIGSSSINRDLTIDRSGPPTLGFSRSGTEKALLAVSNTTDGVIAGDVAGDFGFRAANQKILFSTDEGVTSSLTLGASGAVIIPALAGSGDRSIGVNSSGQLIELSGGGGSGRWEDVFSGGGIEYNDGSYVLMNSTNPDFRMMDPAHNSPFGSMIDQDVALRLTTNGAAFFQGFSNNGGQALNLAGHVGATTVTQSAIVFSGFKSDGAGSATTLGSSESLWEVHNGSYSSGNHELRLNGDGGLILSATKYATSGVAMMLTVNNGVVGFTTIPGGGGGGSTNWVDASANSYNTGSVTVGSSTINRAISIDKTGAPTLGFSRSGTEKALLAVSNTTDGIITGDVAGDFGFRAANQKILFSTDEGATSSLTLGASQAVTMPVLAGSGTRMVVASSTGVLSTQTIPGGGSSQWTSITGAIQYDVAASSVIIGDAVSGFEGINGSLSVMNTGANSVIYLGQSATAYGSIGWVYNSTEASAKMQIGSLKDLEFLTVGTTRLAISAAGGIRMPSLGGSGAGYVAVDNSGNLTWSAGSGGGGGMTNPMTTAGDIIYGGSSGTPTRLAAGTATYVLTSNGAGTAPSWQAAAGSGVDFYTTDGTLTGTRTVSGASNTLNLGATGSKLSNLVFNVTNKVLVADGAMQYNVYSTSDANFSFDGMANFVEMVTSITANRTLTMPSASGQGNGTVVKIILPFSANSFHWSLNAGITDIKTGSTFTQLEWGTTYEFYVTGALTWLLIDKY